jgi:hypothetical protein
MSQQSTDIFRSFGMSDFLGCIGNYEGSTFSVDAPFDEVIKMLLNLKEIQRWRSVKLGILKPDAEKRTTCINGQVGSIFPVVEVFGWICVP